MAIQTMALPVLFKEISDELGLNLVQVGAIWGLGALAGMFTGLLGGSIGDRFGASRTLTIACLLAGLAGLLRAFAVDFTSLAAAMLFFGFVTPVIPMNVHKTCGIWFSGRHLGLANGIVSVGMALGFTIGSLISATLVSPWLGGWRNTLILYGVVAMAMSIPWALAKAEPDEAGTSPQKAARRSMRQALGHVVRLRPIWLLGLAVLGINGCIQGTLGYLPLYLREIGWPVVQADSALATFHAVSMVAAIPIALWSDRLGSRKKVLMVAAGSIMVGVGWLTLAQGVLVWAAVGLAGVFRDGFMALFMTSVIETRGVGAAYAGTATGLTMVFLQLGYLVTPPLGNSLAAWGPSVPFAFWAALAGLGLVCFYFFREPGAEELAGPAPVLVSKAIS
jgi:cyanate permease